MHIQKLDPNTFYSLTCAHLVDFTPPSEFLPHLENFTPNPKNVRNTIIIVNTNIFIGRKILSSPLNFYPPPPKLLLFKNVLFRMIHVNFYLLGKSFFLLDLNSKIFKPGVNFFNFILNILQRHVKHFQDS